MHGREERLHALAKHPWFGRSYAKLGAGELKLMFEFLEKNKHLGKDDFEMAAVRMFLDVSDKPKNWSRIVEMLTNINV